MLMQRTPREPAAEEDAEQRQQIKGQIQGLRAALRQQQPPPPPRNPSPGRRPVSPGRRPLSPAAARGPAAPGSGGNPRSGRKSDCVLRVEQMQKQREERRKKAEAAKARRAEEARDAEGRGGIESVDFLRKIREYRKSHNLTDEPTPWPAERGDVWGSNDPSRIRVCVRKRPMLRVERLRHDFDVITCEPSHEQLVVHEPRTKVDLAKAIESHRFLFDAVYNESDTNEHIYASALRPLLSHVFNGGQATVFAFGQTGSGKTCTMAGHGDESVGDGNDTGLYAFAATDIMALAETAGLSVGVSFFEVYRGQVTPAAPRPARSSHARRARCATIRQCARPTERMPGVRRRAPWTDAPRRCAGARSPRRARTPRGSRGREGAGAGGRAARDRDHVGAGAS